MLLLIDIFSAYGNAESVPPLQNVQVEFLPSNATSQVQPLDSGIIA